MNRRQFIFSAAALAVFGGLSLRPEDNGKPYNAYFNGLNENLKDQGTYVPSLLIDLNTVDKNIDILKQQLNPSVDYRIVAKSLPSSKLLGYIMDRAKTNKLMVFHQPFLSKIARDYPNSDVLMGKPMPVNAANNFYAQQKDQNTTNAFDSSKQLQWLIDSKERLVQYLAMAQSYNQLLQINIEIDVGLRRGGLQQANQLDSLLDIIRDNPKHLKFTGFMGYDPHVVKIPSILKSPQDAYQESQNIYQSFITQLYAFDSDYKQEKLCFNGAGSPTVLFHKTQTVANELSAGSCLVKPVDFDIPSLESFNPAAYIASPILKKMQGTQIPAIEFAKNVLPLWDKNMQQTYFIYGGKWLARYESPQGLQDNGLFGSSTNQEMVNGSNQTALDIDDHIFLRPSQSEHVFLQFGDIKTVRNGQLTDNWPILTHV